MTFRMRQTFAISSFNNWYFSTFSSSLSFTLSSPGIATSIMTTSLSFLSIKSMSGLLASIFRSHWIVKSHSILEFSLSTTLSGFCSYQLLALSNPHLPQSCQWIYRATLSCLPLYSVCASLPHSVTTCMGHRFSLTSAHSAQRGFCCAINVKPRIIRSQRLFLSATYQGPSTSFQISLCKPLPSTIPVNTFLFSHILPMHSFLLPFILHLFSCGSTAPEMSTTLLSPTFLSNASSLFSHTNYYFQLLLLLLLLSQLEEFALSHPQACYAAYTFGLKHRWTYFLRTLPHIQELLEPLENAISKVLIPAITEHRCTRLDRDILALPVRLGGLGMTNPCLDANLEQSSSVKVTIPLVQQIVAQSHLMPDDSLVKSLQQAMRSERATVLQDREEHIRGVAPQKVQRALDLAVEKGSSVWLTVLFLREMGFNLNKREFRDAIKLRYDWPVDDIPSTCVCGDAFTVDHAMICKRGGFVTQRHNELRDLEAELLNMVCTDVEIEPGKRFESSSRCEIGYSCARVLGEPTISIL